MKDEMVKVEQTMVSEKSTKSEKATAGLFHFLGLKQDDYSNLSFTPEEAQKIRSHLSHLVTGAAAAVPLVCGGENKCPFAAQCPFVRLDQERKKKGLNMASAVPIGKQCLVEIELLNKWTFFYIDEYDIDEQSFTEVQMVRELAEIELMLWRLNNNLAKPENAELVQEVNVGVDKEGNILTRQEMNAFITTKETLQNRKTKLVKLMVGDRQEKYKREAALKMRAEADPSTTAAQLRSQMDQLVRKTKQLDTKLKEAEGNVIEGENLLPESTEKTTLSPEDLLDSEE